MSKIALSGPASGTATYTISAPTGATDRTITLPDVTGTLVTSTSGSVSQAMLASGVAGNGPAFSAYKSGSNQSLTGNTYTKITFDTEEFDTNSAYDNTTNYRFTPQVAGYYQISSKVELSGSGSSRNLIAIYKNGAIFKVGTDLGGLSPSTLGATISTVIYLNGSTDYVEIYCYCASSFAAYSGSQTSYFSGAMVRAA